MCGIAGMLGLSSHAPSPELLGRMIHQIRHRGPDASDLHVDANVGLAHARLTILDPNTGGQPMANEDRTLWVTFNGEIFNYIELREELLRRGHTFATVSDTEVILHAYEEFGDECVHHFNGQWAFAIWDSNARRLFLSRDRLGVRPLFYRRTSTLFAFASEAKAIFALPNVSRELDPIALDQIFTFWVPLPPRTIFKDISELQPGHSLTVTEHGDVSVSRYWSPRFDTKTTAGRPEHELADELRTLLTDATRLRLRSDVPVGAYLSGGLDSTIVASLVGQTNASGLTTFSLSFDDPEFDESPFQREASTFCQTVHQDLRCSAADVAHAFPSTIWHCERPVLRTAPTPMLLLSRFVREHRYKVVLTGEGADEVFGGYDIFKEAKVRRFCARRPDSPSRYRLLKRLYPYLPAVHNQSAAYLKAFFQVGNPTEPFYSHTPRWRTTAQLKALFSDDLASQTRGYDGYRDLAASLPPDYAEWEHFCQAQYLEMTLLLPGYILSSQGDRMAMAHGVEGRFPFLDHRVVEFAGGLPPAMKMKVLEEKYLLKRATRDVVPPAITAREKQPYRSPDVTCFFRSPVPPYVDELLSPDRIKADGLFDADAVSALTRKCRGGKPVSQRDRMGLVGVLSTALLMDQYVRDFGERPSDA